MVDQSFDWPAFQRLDNAAVMDFLTSTASALCEAGILTSKDTDNLRLVLSGVGSAAESRERPLLLELDRQHAEFLGILTARFGAVGLCLNLIRHTLRGNLTDSRRIIADLGQGLVKKSELLFNRPFFIYRAGKCQKQTLYSTVLVDFSEALAGACDLLERALDDLSLMNPNDMAAAQAADVEVDLAIARALGFKGLLSHSLPLHAETLIKRKVSQALAMVADAAAEISEQLTANMTGTGPQAESGYAVVSACEWLKAECQRLGLLEFPQSESLMAWEVRRRNLSACVSSINDALRHVAEASLASFSADSTQSRAATAPSQTAPARLPEATKRRIVFDMIASGTSPAKADEAASALLRYLTDNALTPKQIIVGELGRIHASLIPKTLETLVALESGAAVMSQSVNEKTETMSRAKRLAETFRKTLTHAAPVLSLPLMALTAILALGAAGCGLKTDPTSEVIEPRPEIPFRDEAPKAQIDGKPLRQETSPPKPTPPTP